MKQKTIEARKAVRSVIGLLAVAWIGLAAAGCGIEDTNGSKIEDVEFTVLEEEAVPEELKRKTLYCKGLWREGNGRLQHFRKRCLSDSECPLFCYNADWPGGE